MSDAPPRWDWGTKAAVLERLAPRLSAARVLPVARVAVTAWRQNPEAEIERLSPLLAEHGSLIVRSSAAHEDGTEASHAGAYTSIPDVDNGPRLATAIEAVIASYGGDGGEDEVLIQPMAQDVIRSGVLFTHDPATGGPYWIVEWTEGSDTTAITSGGTGRRYVRSHLATTAAPPELAGVLEAAREIDVIVGGAPVDIEFAVTTDDVLILQARPLVMSRSPDDPHRHAHALREIRQHVERGCGPHPFLVGTRSVFGVMPDWNPAEIIGIRPRPLALSLYRELITDEIWAYQRNNYGYRNLRSHPLIHDLGGVPYVDVRVSLNSFIPADLDDALAGKLVDHYLHVLQATPALHDKVEFEVALTCFTFDIDTRLAELGKAGFTDAECHSLRESLRRLTQSIFSSGSGPWHDDANRLPILRDRREHLEAHSEDPVTNMYWLLEDCKRYGTLPFAGLARGGFIAVELLRSLVRTGAIGASDARALLESVTTVATRVSDAGVGDRDAFLRAFGHLRPGTYDIRSERYDANPDRYFAPAGGASMDPTTVDDVPELAPEALDRVQARLDAAGFELTAAELIAFIRRAIELREEAKFLFTKNLSDFLEVFAAYGATLGHTRDDLSFARVDVVYELYRSSGSAPSVLQQSIDAGRSSYAVTCGLTLPLLIATGDDVYAFEAPPIAPNFVTQERIVAPVATNLDPSGIRGCVVCIESADPGFDWIFAHAPAALVTAFGGTNSHMAIRANELRLPAVVGVGADEFRRLAKARRLLIDCAEERVQVAP